MTTKNPKLSFLYEQKSIPANELSEPAPSDSDIEDILQAAMSAPDHGYLTPYRFLTIQGNARHELSRVFEKSTRRRNPDVDEATVLKQKNKPLRSPLIMVVIAHITDNPKIPEIEQLLSAGCAAQHIQLACSSLGYGSVWVTGENSYDLTVYEALGLEINERIIGFIYVGTPSEDSPLKTRQQAIDITERWETALKSEFSI